MKNRPYVKQYDAQGELINPMPIGGFKHPFPNRRARRRKLGRLFSNKKGVQLIIMPVGREYFKAVKHLQRIIGDPMMKNGKTLVQFQIKTSKIMLKVNHVAKLQKQSTDALSIFEKTLSRLEKVNAKAHSHREKKIEQAAKLSDETAKLSTIIDNNNTIADKISALLTVNL